MKHLPTPLTLLTAAAALVMAVLCVSSAQAAELRPARGPRVQGQYIVVLKDDAARLAGERNSRPATTAVAQAMARAHGLQLSHAYEQVLRGFAARADVAALRRLLADPRVAYVEEDSVVFADATRPRATWGLDRIDQRERPLDGTYRFDTTAAGVHAYIIDTGIRASHADFGGRVGAGYSTVGDGKGTADCNGHGTHVAGTVGGARWGVAKGVRLHPVRVLGCNGSGSQASVIAGMDWVARHHVKPAVANMSLSGGASTATDDAVTRLVNAGVMVVAAAGNDNANACNYSPARALPALTVAATTSADARSSFSNFGACVDLFAPGSSITSAWSSGDTATSAISGTSMATPHVTGVAALYLAGNPAAAPTSAAAAVLDNASAGRVTDAAGSPNRLLHALFARGSGCVGIGGALLNGVAARHLCGAANAELRFTLTVPADAGVLRFDTAGGTGDADLYVRHGRAPTTSAYDCSSQRGSNADTCTIAGSARAGTWHVLLKGHAAFSGATLTARYGSGASSARAQAIADHATVHGALAMSGAGTASSTAQVGVDIRHRYRGDLRIDLIAPDGTAYLLKNHNANDSGDDVVATWTVNLSSERKAGTWRLRVRDNARDDLGHLAAWSLTL